MAALFLLILLGDPAADGNALLRAGRCSEAIPLLKQARPDNPLVWYDLGYCYRKLGQLREAVTAYQRYATLRPGSPDPYYGLGVAHRALGDLDAARAAFRKYLELEKRPAEQKWVDKAREQLAELDRPAPPPDPKVENEKGYAQLKQGRLADAIAAFQQSVRIDPTFALGWYNLAHAYRKSGRAADSITAYQKYARLRPNDPDPWYGLGQAYKDLGRQKEAVDAFERYIAMESRPGEQPWVDKARQELAALRPPSNPRADVATAQQTLAAHPADAAPLRELGEALRAAGDDARGRYFLELYVFAAEPIPELAAAVQKVRAELAQ